jgi:hypothetical protein
VKKRDVSEMLDVAVGCDCIGGNLPVHLLQVYAVPKRCGQGWRTTVKPAAPLDDER